jgi:hypothetical protein
VHLRASPASRAIQKLDDWQIGLIYETAMNYPVEWLRKSYFEQKKSVNNFDDEDLADLGYSPEDIAQIKGR